MAPGDPGHEQRQSPMAPVQPQRPWGAHRTPSSDSVVTTASMPTAAPTTSHPPLRKRHSNYLRGTERSTSPIPELPPTRPPRHPARPNSIYPPSSSRPSTAASAKSDHNPWESQIAAATEERSRTRSGAPSIRSKASSIGLGGVSTGPVEDVTPWELYPAPATASSNKPHSTTSSIPLISSASSPRFPHISKPTGATEDVTPWELYAEPDTEINSPIQQQPVLTESPQASILLPARSKAASVISNGSYPVQRQSTATGPAEEVTPWEVQSPTASKEPTEKAHRPAQQRLSLTLSKAQLEDVMPWELYPAPPTPALPASMKNGTSSVSAHTLDVVLLLNFEYRTGLLCLPADSQNSDYGVGEARAVDPPNSAPNVIVRKRRPGLAPPKLFPMIALSKPKNRNRMLPLCSRTIATGHFHYQLLLPLSRRRPNRAPRKRIHSSRQQIGQSWRN